MKSSGDLQTVLDDPSGGLRALLNGLDKRRRLASILRLARSALPWFACTVALVVLVVLWGDGPLVRRVLEQGWLVRLLLLFGIGLLVPFVLAVVTGLVVRRGADPHWRRVAGEVDDRLGLEQRLVTAAEILEADDDGAGPGAMARLVLRDTVDHVEEGAVRRLYPRPALVGTVFLTMALAVAPGMALVLAEVRWLPPPPTMDTTDMNLPRGGAGEAEPAPVPVRLLIVEPYEGQPGDRIELLTEGAASNDDEELGIQFGPRSIMASRLSAERFVFEVPAVQAGIVSIRVSEQLSSSNALPFLVLPSDGSGGGGEGEDEDENEPNEPEGDTPNEQEPDDPAPEEPQQSPPPPQPEAMPEGTTEPVPPPTPEINPEIAVPLTSEDGQRRLKEALVLEPDPDGGEANRTTEDAESGSVEGPAVVPFARREEDAVNRPDLSPEDREVVRRYFERLRRAIGEDR